MNHFWRILSLFIQASWDSQYGTKNSSSANWESHLIRLLPFVSFLQSEHSSLTQGTILLYPSMKVETLYSLNNSSDSQISRDVQNFKLSERKKYKRWVITIDKLMIPKRISDLNNYDTELIDVCLLIFRDTQFLDILEEFARTVELVVSISALFIFVMPFILSEKELEDQLVI